MTRDFPEHAKHPHVGAYSCLYVHSLPCEMGRVRNLLSFYIHPGDNPDWWWAQRMMPTVVTEGPIEGVFEGLIGGCACPDPDAWPQWECEIHAGRSVFRTVIPSPSIRTLDVVLQDLGGGVIRRGAKPPSRWKRICLFFRYYWLRRPVIRRRDPIEM